MLKIEKTVLPSPEQWEIIIEGIRNPMNSWNLSDSCTEHIENPQTMNTADFQFHLGENDHKLDEWHAFCDWIEQLPYSELITGGD